MSHQHKSSLAIGLAAIVSVLPATAAPPPPSRTPVSHNEQGDLMQPPPKADVADRPAPLPPDPPPPCLADADRNGAVNSADVSAFIATWMHSIQTGSLEADVDGSGDVSSADIPCFLSAWTNAVATGC